MAKKSGLGATRLAVCAMLLAVMLVLGWVESMLPALGAVPGIKLGLSNSVLIFAVYMLDIPTAYLLMVMKVLLSGALFGNVSAMMYAGAGGVLSLTVMALISRIRGVAPVTVSVVGGVFHNVGQVGLAMLILQTTSLLTYLAVLIFAGAVCGALTGVCATLVMQHLKGSFRKRVPGAGVRKEKPAAEDAAKTAEEASGAPAGPERSDP